MVKVFAASMAVVLVIPVPLLGEGEVPFGSLHVHWGSQAEHGLGEHYRFNDWHLRYGLKGLKYLNDDFESSFIIEVVLTGAEHEDTVKEVRQVWLGGRGAFGELRVGRHLSPGRVSLQPLDLFAEQHARFDRILEVDKKYEASLVYLNRLPMFEEVGYAVALSGNGDGAGLAVDTLINYQSDGVYAAFAYLNDAADSDVIRLGFGYRQPEGVVGGVAAEHVTDRHGQNDHRALTVNGGYQQGKVLLKTQFGWNNPSAAGTTEVMAAIGADYQLNDATVLQLEYARNRHRDHSAEDDEQTVSLGLSYRF